MTLPKSVPAGLAKRVKHWDDERSIGNSIIITTAHGFAFEPHENENVAEHVRGYDTVTDAIKALRKRARPCSCDRCKS